MAHDPKHPHTHRPAHAGAAGVTHAGPSGGGARVYGNEDALARIPYVRIGGALIAFIGALQFFLPYLLGYRAIPAALWNGMLLGLVLILLGVLIAREPLARGRLGSLAAVVGVWLFISPFVLGYADIYATPHSFALWANLVGGVFTILFGVFAASEAAGLSEEPLH